MAGVKTTITKSDVTLHTFLNTVLKTFDNSIHYSENIYASRANVKSQKKLSTNLIKSKENTGNENNTVKTIFLAKNLRILTNWLKKW